MKNPCLNCDVEPLASGNCPNPKRCPDYREYKGYQEGLAESTKKREQEIVEWIRELPDQDCETSNPHVVFAWYPKRIAIHLQSWLNSGKG